MKYIKSEDTLTTLFTPLKSKSILIKILFRVKIGVYNAKDKNKDNKNCLTKKEIMNSLNEVRILASIDHINVISYKEAFYDKKTTSLWIIMEYANDKDLYQ